jgi:hypothetical protein
LIVPKLNWSDFHDNHPASHYVRLAVPKDEEGSPLVPLREVHATVTRLISKLQPSGSYALAVSRETGDPEVHCAFAEGEDADLLAAAIAGQPVQPSPRQRLVTLSPHAYGEVLKRAGKPGRGSRRPLRHASG